MDMTSINSIFIEKAKNWIADEYIVDILYVLHEKENKNLIYNSFIIINPLISHNSNGFTAAPLNFNFGHYKNLTASKNLTLSLLSNAIDGKIITEKFAAELPNYTPRNSYSNMNIRGNWFSPLHIKLQGRIETYYSASELNLLDHELRVSSPPFDGLNDILGHLGLPNAIESTDAPYIEIVFNPPADLILDKTTLSSNQLTIHMVAHKNFDETRVRLTIRTLPGHSLNNRMEITSEIKWDFNESGEKIGVALLELQETDSILAMVSIDNHTVRRHWVNDNNKTKNLRHLSIQNFDESLSKTNYSIFHETDSRIFEKGVANLFFMHGFNSCQPIDQDAPDIILHTPSGKIVLVECTFKIADFSNKLGKLVDRRGALKKSFSAQEIQIEPIAILVCRLPHDQIPTKRDELQAHQVILLANENLTELYQTIKHPKIPDIFLDDEFKKISKTNLMELIK